MSGAPFVLTTQLALLSSISFGGIPSVLPDIRHLVVDTHRWLTDREFANYFAVVQAVPGPNMILMMSLIGWKVWGIPGAAASALATFGPPSAIYYTGFRLWDRFRDTRWQRMLRRGLAPVTFGVVIASGVVMAQAADSGWRGAALTGAAAALMLTARVNPVWLLVAAAGFGGLGLI